MTKVAVVSGSNKGVGFGIVRALCKQFDGDVILTARSVENGTKAVEELKKEGLNPKFHQLDITDKASIESLKNFLQDNYGGIDVLVNNAAIAYKGDDRIHTKNSNTQASTASFAEQAEVTTKTNFWALIDVCNSLFPILRPGARVANVSSFVSPTTLRKCSDGIKERVLACQTVADIEALIKEFVELAQAGKHEEHGWPNTAYGVSKLGVTVLSSIQHKQLAEDASRPDIVLNACCPGFVKTDMTSGKGKFTIDEVYSTGVETWKEGLNICLSQGSWQIRVTGSNKGIGFAIVRGLCKKFDGDVILTARTAENGARAVEELKKEGLNPKFHVLDITKKPTVEALKTFLVDNYGGLDVLVNNAGIAFGGASTVPFEEQVEVTMATNFWAQIDTCNILFPILRPGARVSNISSFLAPGTMAGCSEDVRKRVYACKTVADVEKLVSEFQGLVRAGKLEGSGWARTGYGVSKIAMTALSIAQHNELAADSSRPDMIVNACDPGFVKTDMTAAVGADLTPDQGAETAVFCALLPANAKSPRGNHVSECKVVPWP